MGAVPNKNAGFIILLTSIFVLFFFGEIRDLTTFTRLIDCDNGFSISFFFFSFFSLDRCSIPSREVSILCSYLDIILLFSSYVYLIVKKKKKKNSELIPLLEREKREERREKREERREKREE